MKFNTMNHCEPLQCWHDALTSLQLLQVDPQGFGGINLRAPHGPIRTQWLRALAELGLAIIKIPGSTDSERLLGGIDLARTLQSGQLHQQIGLLQQADQGLVCLPMAERLPQSLWAPLMQALDSKTIPSSHLHSNEAIVRFGVVALDESLLDEPPVQPALTERLAIWLDLHALSLSDTTTAAFDGRSGELEDDSLHITLSPEALKLARHRLTQVRASEAQLDALCAAALGLGMNSLRVPSLALRVACGHAALHERSVLEEEDLGFAARCVLAPRATQWPAEAHPESSQEPEIDPSPPEPAKSSQPDDLPRPEPENATDKASRVETEPSTPSAQELQEMMVAAALASLPAHILDTLSTTTGSRTHSTSGRSGHVRSGQRRGRPLPPRPGRPGGHARLHILATLRAAAPRQRLRQGKSQASIEGPISSRRVAIRAEDFHLQRYQQRASSCLILALDASGSAALQRLAEAKGAVQLLLLQSYARRDSVCIVAFRGAQAQLLLPVTRSPVRAQRAMTGLPGGGGTPLALALKMAHEQALQLHRQGVTPLLVVLSDGRANVTLQGIGGRAQAQIDAQVWAQQWMLTGHRALWIDTGLHPDIQTRQLAATMGANYLPMPQVQAQRMAHAMSALRSDSP